MNIWTEDTKDSINISFEITTYDILRVFFKFCFLIILPLLATIYKWFGIWAIIKYIHIYG